MREEKTGGEEAGVQLVQLVELIQLVQLVGYLAWPGPWTRVGYFPDPWESSGN